MTPSMQCAEPVVLSSSRVHPGHRKREWKRGPSLLLVSVVRITPRLDSPSYENYELRLCIDRCHLQVR
jgi:hypothetical protein